MLWILVASCTAWYVGAYESTDECRTFQSGDDVSLLQRRASQDSFSLEAPCEAPCLQRDSGTPGFIMERLFHEEAVSCPWQSPGQAPDEDCKRRLAHINELRDAIAQCERPLAFTERAIGHRGAPLVAPEESLASWQIGARSGAGYLECDASVTKDLELTCRHSNCDLDSTTDLVTNHPDLNAKCRVPFVPGSGMPATCCTFDFTMKELSRLCAIMENEVNKSATVASEYLIGFPGFRSNATGNVKCHKVESYAFYLKLLKKSGFHAIPELKDTWNSRTEDFLKSKGKNIYWLADKFANMLQTAGFKPWPQEGKKSHPGTLYGIMQTFDYRLAEHWKTTRPKMMVEYMWQVPPPEGANCSDGNGDYNGPSGPGGDCGGEKLLQHLNQLGVNMFSPPIRTLLASGPGRTIVPSATAKILKEMNVESIGSWSLERQGCSPKPDGPNAQPPTAALEASSLAPCWDPDAWYYSTTDGRSTWQHLDVLPILDALFKKVGIRSMFSDYPATVAAYANCVLDA
ncbi:unnamed protein product [Polarella glacialis]|uniref:glycerophosphodiester phosphodiesterase n=1 Tax=Polarella glacialis TaxID=89957 RepID=A0A813KJC6_POLGL|nr:unnamed protein product [Polarella glacialis]CAE8706262.1 unnamed protein product [Polarella glacialis]